MKSEKRHVDKDLYRKLRNLSCDDLWKNEVSRFDKASPRERIAGVAVIRAVGVAFSKHGTAEQKSDVRAWLIRLLNDPAEKVRRYAMAAMPKMGTGSGEEAELLALLKRTSIEREKANLGRTLDKIGGTATLEAVDGAEDLPLQTRQKVKASVARRQEPSAILMDRTLSQFGKLRIHLRCRKGLETIVRNEVEEYAGRQGKFRVIEAGRSLVAITPTAPFALADIYRLRCFGTVGFVLGTVRNSTPGESIEALAAVIASPLAKRVMSTFTEGALRYRLDFVALGHQRGAVRQLANRVYAMCPEILNDAREAPWSIDIHPMPRGVSVELRPRLAPDPRFYYRRQDLPASSHPPLAACMARLAGRAENEIVWDPFCGSGLELIESALLGGVHSLYGTDLSPDAVAIARANLAAADVKCVQSRLTCCDFRESATVEGLGPGSVTLIVTNPPMGRRIRVPSLHRLIEDIFAVAAVVLKPGGRLVFPNPLRVGPGDSSLKLQTRQVIDMGGFDCRLEMYLKLSS